MTNETNRAAFAGHRFNVVFHEIYGTFLCTCGEASGLDDCMLPAYHECPHCKRFFVIDFTITETEKAQVKHD